MKLKLSPKSNKNLCLHSKKMTFITNFPFFHSISLKTHSVPTQGSGPVLDCYACHSINGSNQRCDDLSQDLKTSQDGFLKEPCILPTKSQSHAMKVFILFIYDSHRARPCGKTGEITSQWFRKIK